MSNILKQTMKFFKQAPAEDSLATTELELVSTGALQKILASNDENAKRDLRKAAESGEGVLARDAENNRYEIVDATGKDDFSLVSTQMLHRMLEKDNPEKEKEKVEVPVAMESGFDPYNSD